MTEQQNELVKFKGINDLKSTLAHDYTTQIQNYFGDQKKALRFMSSVTAAVQRNPKLLECTQISFINSFMMVAQCEFMPSDVSGEAYVLPYKSKKKVGNAWVEVMEAQFQLGYQGIVTLLYRAGAKSIVSELVHKNDVFKIINTNIYHEIDPFKTLAERGEVIGAYAIITTKTGGEIGKFMRIEDIVAHGKKFSKSFASEFSPWNASNDPEGWMPRKTVLKQAAKLAPKNETLNIAIAEDNKDSIIADRIEAAKAETKGLTMGNLQINDKTINQKHEAAKERVAKKAEGKEGQDKADAPEGLPEIQYDEE